jgi:Transposase DDE domain group 1
MMSSWSTLLIRPATHWNGRSATWPFSSCKISGNPPYKTTSDWRTGRGAIAAPNDEPWGSGETQGTAAQWIKEGKQATHWTRLSCHRFRANEVRLQLSVLAYNLGNLCRRVALPRRIASWSVTSLQQRLVKTGGRIVKHARYYWLLLAEGHLHRRLFGDMLRRIWALPVLAG